LFVIIAFFVIIVAGFAAKYFNRPDSQMRSTSSSSCASSTDSNYDNVLVELIDLSSNSPIIRRWAQVRPENIKSYTNSAMNSFFYCCLCLPLSLLPPPPSPPRCRRRSDDYANCWFRIWDTQA
jgi:hypothetical protein